jgi:hypothetical protein
MAPGSKSVAVLLSFASLAATASTKDSDDPQTPSPAREFTTPVLFAAGVDGALTARARGYTAVLRPARIELSASDELDRTQLAIELRGADAVAGWEVEAPAGTRSRHGSDGSSVSRTQYARARLRGAYPGIDVVAHGEGGLLEYDFELQPAADPGRIRFVVTGHDHAWIDDTGALVVWVRGRVLRVQEPVAFQRGATDGLVMIPARFELHESGEVAIDLDAYDHARPLIIDPVIEFDQLATSYAAALARSADGGMVVCGSSRNRDEPDPATWNDDVELTRFDAQGRYVWSAEVGGFDDDWCQDVAMGPDGSLYFIGTSLSADFQGTAGAFMPQRPVGGSGFLAKLASDGSDLLFVTFLGGGQEDTRFPGSYYGYTMLEALAAGADGSVYVTGTTGANNFPTTPGVLGPSGAWCGTRICFRTGFVSKFAPDGRSLAYSTVLHGGSDLLPADLVVDPQGRAYVVGAAPAANGFGIPARRDEFLTNAQQAVQSGYDDVFVALLRADASAFVFATYLGGGDSETARAVTLDAFGLMHVVGDTTSADFPGVPPNSFHGSGDLFVATFDPSGKLRRSTLAGGSQPDGAAGIVGILNGSLVLSGRTYSGEWLTPPSSPGESVGFVLLLSPDRREIASSQQFHETQISGAVGIAGARVAVLREHFGSDGAEGWLTGVRFWNTTFQPRPGNDWWVETRVSGDAGLAGVDARVSGGAWTPLMPTSYGTWARSFYVPPASIVEFRARSASGERSYSGGYLWPHAGAVPPEAAAFQVNFVKPRGSSSWVETDVAANEPVRAAFARVNGGPWQELPRTVWRSYAASIPAPSGSIVEFRADSADGDLVQSVRYAWPSAVPVTDPSPVGFTASFTGVLGNGWWVQTSVSANQALSGVDVRLNGGGWTALTRQSWGGWARSMAIATGTLVEFQARSSSGGTALSARYRWPDAVIVDGTAPPAFAATFANVRGNTWWIQATVSANASLAGVDARVNGGAWTALALQSWGDWARSINAPSGSRVELRARSTSGASAVSAAYTWPPP